MNVWVLKHGEQLPFNEKTRTYRMGMISLYCESQGDSVTWWTSSFNHAMKKREEVPENLNTNISFKFLDGISYSKNISLQRLVNHYQIGKKLNQELYSSVNKPDLIICSMPTIDFAYKAVKYAKSMNIPIVVDVRDLWPDVFLDLLPYEFIRKDILLKKSNRKLEKIFKNSTAITSITNEYLEWTLKKGRLEFNSDIHKVFPIGYPDIINKKVENPFDSDYFNIIFAGTIGMHFDLETVLEAVRLIKDKKIRLYIIGDGDKLKDLKFKYSSKDIFFTGWLDGEQVDQYLRHADVGIAPYKNTKNFLMNVPNKFYEYMSMGIPVLTSLGGSSAMLVSEYRIGLSYQENNSLDLSEKIVELQSNSCLYNEMSNNARQTFKSKYSASTIYKQYYDFLREVAKMKK